MFQEYSFEKNNIGGFTKLSLYHQLKRGVSLDKIVFAESEWLHLQSSGEDITSTDKVNKQTPCQGLKSKRVQRSMGPGKSEQTRRNYSST